MVDVRPVTLEFLSDFAELSLVHSTGKLYMRHSEVNQTQTRRTQFLMFSAVYLWEIYFLEACHFFVECNGWGFC